MGPGWWQASDGKWYAPDLHSQAELTGHHYPPPSPTFPPPYPTYPPPYPPQEWGGPIGWRPRSTNGLAIASMVLGILWIYWIGSIVALIFGCIALRQIRVRNQGGRGMAVAGIVLGAIGAATGTAVLILVLAIGITTNGSDRVPNPEHLVAGKRIALPHAMFLANPPGSSVLITPTQANLVGKTLWSLWETALIQRDTTALTQLVSAGPVLASELNECAWPTGGCVDETQPRPIVTIESVVPVQRTYPLHFLTQIRTDEYLGENSGPPKLSSWVELQVLTKAGPSSPWQLSFDTGYNGVTAVVPGIPFDQERVGVQDSGNTSAAFNPAPIKQGPVAASRFLPLLAGYWQSWKDTGAAPPHTVFAQDGDTSGFGQQLAGSRQGAVYGGIEQRYLYRWYPGGGSWEFSVNGGYPMVCGSISVALTSTPVSGGPLNQNLDRTNWGMSLAPGEYTSIVTENTHQSCVHVVANNQLDAAGGPTENSLTVTGTPASG
jgi:hypothetical protein